MTGQAWEIAQKMSGEEFYNVFGAAILANARAAPRGKKTKTDGRALLEYQRKVAQDYIDAGKED